MWLALLALTFAKDRALDPGDVDVGAGWSTTPRVRGTGGLALWSVSWWATRAALDVGVLRRGPIALSLGAEGSYGRPWLTQGFVNGVLDAYVITNRIDLSAESWSLGARGRGALVVRDASVLQPFVALGVTRRQLTLRSAWDGAVVGAEAVYGLSSVQVSPGTGLGLVLGRGLLLAWEVRWSRGVWSQTTSSGALRLGPYDVAEASGENHRREAPKGLTGSFTAGWRF